MSIVQQRTGIALAGNLILDYYKEIDKYPKASTLATIKSVSQETGGLVCNCAQGLSRIDPLLPVTVIGRIGHDAAGEYIQQQFSRYKNIRQEYMIIEEKTSFTDAMIDSQNMVRTYFQFRGANANLVESDFCLDELSARILHVGYILLLDSLDKDDEEYGTVLARVLHHAQAHGLKTSIDVVSEDSDRFGRIVPKALKYADYAIMNEYEASKTTGIPVRDETGQINIDKAFEICDHMLKMGVSTWAVIHAREGAIGVSAQGESVALPALDLSNSTIQSTIGAGDAFLSGCLYGAYQGYNLEHAIKLGIASATTSLRCFNATEGILPVRQLELFYDMSPKENQQAFRRSI